MSDAAREHEQGAAGTPRSSLQSLVVMLDRRGPSFCYYEPPLDGESDDDDDDAAASERERMSLELFERALSYAQQRDLALQIVAGANGVPAEIAAAVGDYPAVCYTPAPVLVGAADGTALAAEPSFEQIPVFVSGEAELIDELPVDRHAIAVLRVAREHLGALPETWRRLAERVHRVVVVLRELDGWDDAALAEHEAALAAISDELRPAYLEGADAELNLISDRMALDGPRECNAGVEHVTVAPDGALHICPGFAAAGAEPIGEVGGEPRVPNAELLTRERAPICSLCDAYHCRRCVYLNQKATLEVNTPPSQLCRASHREREASRLLLDRLHERGAMRGFRAIAAIDYDDPLDVLLDGKDRRPEAEPGSAPPPRGRPLPPRRGAEPRPRRTTPAETHATTPRPRRTTPPETRAGDGRRADGRVVVGRVTEAQRNAIRELHIRKRGLSELVSSLAQMGEAELAASPLYNRLVRDMGATAVEFQDWWDRMAAEYRWQGRGQQWTIDFATCEILLDEDGTTRDPQ